MSKYLAAIFIVLFVSQAWTSDKNAVYELVPKDGDEYEVKDNAIYYRKGQAGLVLQAATPDSIAAYFAERGAPGLGNPFLQTPDLSNCTVFEVTLFNRSNGSLTFTPGYITLKIKTDASFPMDFSVLLGALEAFPPAQQKIMEKSIFHSPETILPGKVVSKFLLFPPLPKKEAEVKLEFDYLYFEDKEVRTNFWFHLRKKS